MSPRFLELSEALALHAMSLERFGGDEGVRDLGLLESALAAPKATWGGALAHCPPARSSPEPS